MATSHLPNNDGVANEDLLWLTKVNSLSINNKGKAIAVCCNAATLSLTHYF